MNEEVVTVELSLSNIWNLIEHLPDSFEEEHKKLRAAKDRFEQTPKVYGKGYGIKVRRNK